MPLSSSVLNPALIHLIRICICVLGSLPCLFLNLYSQTLSPDACGTDVSHQRLYRSDQEYRDNFDRVNDRLYEIISNQLEEELRNTSRNGNSCKQVVTLPVVVHIMHLPSDASPDNNTSNITNARVQAGIDHLNDAFRNRGAYAGGPYHTNAGVQSVDVEIEFTLAKRAPDGSATNGIVRVPTSYSNLYRDDLCSGGREDDCMKALSIWDPTKYINVWLVNEICDTRADDPGSCWIGGYAYYANSHGQAYDGVVNEARYWGANVDDSKLHIHEFGHYFNLFHTFESENCVNDNCLVDGDRVCDTPPDLNGTIYTSCNSPNPDFRVANSCNTDANDASSNNPFQADVQDMYENYMDYGYWVCQNTFTQGQKDRMRAALFGIRSSLLESEAIIPYNSALDAGIQKVVLPQDFVCESNFTPIISVKNYGLNPITSLIIQGEVDGVDVGNSNWTGNLQPGESINITLNAVSSSFEGTHTFKAIILDANNIGKDSFLENDEACTDYEYRPSTIVNTLPYCLDSESAPLFPDGWSRQNDYRSSLWKAYSGGITNCSDNESGALYLDTWGNAEIELASEDILTSNVFDLTNYSTAELSFDWAYIRAFSPLSLRVEISTDCGNTYTTLSSKNELNLASASGFAYSSLWVPTNCNDWSSETIDLSGYVGGKIMVRFVVGYTASAAYSQRLYLDNICLDGFQNVVLPCTGPTAIPTAEGIYVADTSCTDNQGWTHYWKKAATTPVTATDVLLLSIQKDGTMELTPDQVTLGITDKYGNQGHNLSNAPYVTTPNGWYVMGRYFDVSPSVQPSSSVPIRFYYDDTDFFDVQQAVFNSPVNGELNMNESLIFYKISPQDPNPSLNAHSDVMAANFKQYTNGPAASESNWAYTSQGAFHQAEFVVNSFSGGGGGSTGAGDASGVFPVELLDFSGQVVEDHIELNWMTASEQNNDRFEIEKLVQGQFHKIGTQKGQKYTTEINAYKHIDKAPFNGSNVYRLKQIDLDGTYQYTSNVEVNFEAGLALAIYPNPSSGKFHFEFPQVPDGKTHLEIFDITGKRLQRFQWKAKHDPVLTVSLEHTQAGVYLYRAMVDGKLFVGKLIKK